MWNSGVEHARFLPDPFNNRPSSFFGGTWHPIFRPPESSDVHAAARILTVHQSKGLEFDTVIIAGMTEDEFPSYYAKRDNKLEEEKRLFYVALTRAKRHVVVTSHTSDTWGRKKRPSSFLIVL